MKKRTEHRIASSKSLNLPGPEYLFGLNAEQLESVRHSGSNLLVHAGAGSGKTRVVIARILHHILAQGIPPWQILAVTFTNKAAREMRERLAAGLRSGPNEQNGPIKKQDERKETGRQTAASNTGGLADQVLIRTFHAFGVWFLRRYAALAGLASGFSIYDEEDGQALLRQAWPGPYLNKRIKPLQHAIARAKDGGLGYCSEPDEAELRESCLDPDFPEAFRRYQLALRSSGNVDFADLLGLPVRVLTEHERVRCEMRRRFCRILVDEYQDSNPLQNHLLQLLVSPGSDAGRAGAGPQELCIVGDEDQMIYGFRGAEIRHILEFQQNFAPAQILRLEQNYRSRAPILRLANQVIGHNRERLGKELRPSKAGGSLPQLHYFDSCEDEAVFVAQKILREPGLSSAILYRTNAQSRTFERVFREWRIPYRLVGNLHFYRREEIKDLVAWLKCLANGRDLVSFARICNKPRRGIGPRSVQKMKQALETLETSETSGTEGTMASPDEEKAGEGPGIREAMRQVLREEALSSPSLKALEDFSRVYEVLIQRLNLRAPREQTEEQTEEQAAGAATGPLLSEMIQEVLEHSRLLDYYRKRDEEEGSERCLNFESLLQDARHYGRGARALVAFLESIELESAELQQEEGMEEQEQQTLITMHNTKGLEFPRVFITGLELGLFPKYDALDTPLRMEEERRLFYVAITRAEEELYLSAAKQRFLYDRFRYRCNLSPLVEELDPDLYEDCRVKAGPKTETKTTAPPAPSTGKAKKSDLSACRQLSQRKELHPSSVQNAPCKEQKGLKDRRATDDPFVVGARVEHLDYGLGYVIQRKRSGRITTLMIKLDDGRLIRLQLEFQREKLDFLGTGI